VTSAERWRRVRAIFDHAIDLDGDERKGYVDEACGEEPGLRDEVWALLEADGAAGSDLAAVVSSASAAALCEDSGDQRERIGPYRVSGVLGRGGMGVVLRAVRDDETYRQDVAIKLIPRHLGGPDARRRFLQERQILAELDHPAIARLLDGGTTEDGLPYLVMEYVDGEPIDAYCRRAGLGLEQRLELVAQVADAVAHAHSRLIVHRDLKPANLLITSDGRPKLLDFGIAKIVDDEGQQLTRADAAPMTPEYASPEQIEGDPVTALSDVYSLGVLLYELLTGASPYGAASRSSPAQLARAISETQPTRPSVAARRAAGGEDRENPGGPPFEARQLEGDLDAIIETALRKEPARRYASAERLAADLRAYLDGRPVSAMADSWAYRANKWVRRSPVTAGLAVMALLAVVVGLGATTLQARRAEREAERAHAEAERANREAAAADQVSQFLERLFAASTPSAAKGRDVTARELLDAGVERVDTELADQPEVRARLLHAMGTAYMHIGVFEQSEELLTRALAERETSGAPLDVAATHGALADLLVEVQRPAEAEPHIGSAIRLYEAGGETRLLVEALGKLGLVLNRQMNLEGAEAALTRAVGLYDQLAEPDDELDARLQLSLASLYADQGKPALALAALERVLAVARRAYGPDHIRTVVALNNVGQAKIEIGRPADAEAPLRDALAEARKLLEPSHPLLGTVLRNLGGSLARQGRLDEAEPVLQEALANHAAAYGEGHFLSQLASTSLGIVRLRQGQTDRAQRRFAQALAVIEPVFGADHLVVSELHHLLGESQRARGEHDRAQRSFERALAIRERIFGADGSVTQETAAALAELSG
jgi:serine/threonine-protein kinase